MMPMDDTPLLGIGNSESRHDSQEVALFFAPQKPGILDPSVIKALQKNAIDVARTKMIRENGRPIKLKKPPAEIPQLGLGVSMFLEFVRTLLMAMYIGCILVIFSMYANASYDCTSENPATYPSFNCTHDPFVDCCGWNGTCVQSAAPEWCIHSDFGVDVIKPNDTCATRVFQRPEFSDAGLQIPVLLFSLGNQRGRPDFYFQIIPGSIITISFMLFIAWFWRQQRLTQQKYQLSSIRATDYSVWVYNLPADTGHMELASFMEQFGAVGKVTVALNNREQLLAIQKRPLLEEEVEEQQTRYRLLPSPEAERAVARSVQVLAEDDEEMKRMKSTKYTCTGHAFVTFVYEKGAKSCLSAFKSTRTWKRKLFNNYGNAPQFRGTKIRVKSAPDPSDIVWENLQSGPWNKRLRKALTTAICLLMIFFSTSLIVACNAKMALPSYYKSGGVNFALNLASILVIIGANVSLFILIPIITGKLERSYLRSGRERVQMARLLFFQCANTMLNVFVVFAPTMEAWYATGGYLVIGVILGDGFLMTFIEYYRPFDIRIPRYFGCKNCFTQRRMNRLYDPPDFPLGMRYQQALKELILAMFFFPGTPFLFILATISITIQFWVDKYNALRIFRVPTKFDNKIGKQVVIFVLPIAVIVHICGALYFNNVSILCPMDCLLCSRLLDFFGTSISGKHLITNLIYVTLLVLFIAFWVPFALKPPPVVSDWERVKEVPFDCVVPHIEEYAPPAGVNTRFVSIPRSTNSQNTPEASALSATGTLKITPRTVNQQQSISFSVFD